MIPSPGTDPAAAPDTPLASPSTSGGAETGSSVASRAVRLAEQLLVAALGQQSAEETAGSAKLARLMENPEGKAFTFAMVDEVFRSRRPGVVAARAEFLRTVVPPSDAVLRAAFAAGLNWIDAPLLARGRLELTRWLREQSVSETRHRYGQPVPAIRRAGA